MRIYSMGYQVSRIIPYILALGLLFLSCEKIEPNLDNPQDPANPDYEPPTVSIIAGPTDGDTVETSTVEFEWEGNDIVSLYRYKFSDNSWTDWTTETAAEFDYLDEGQYNFQVQSSYSTGDTSVVVTVSFVVDAVHGPALMFYPRRHIVGVGDTVTFHILAEEVENLTAAEFLLIFDPNIIEIVSLTEGTLLSGWGESIYHSEINNTQGIVSIVLALLGGEYPSVSGTGDLATIEVTVRQSGATELLFGGPAVFKDPNNDFIAISSVINGMIYGF